MMHMPTAPIASYDKAADQETVYESLHVVHRMLRKRGS